MAGYTSVTRDPLFIRFANGNADYKDILHGLLRGSEDEETKAIAEAVLEEYKEKPLDLSEFRSDIRHLLNDLIENGVILPVTQYLNTYMEPSVEEMSIEHSYARTGETKTWLRIKNKDAPWMEAIVCYNISMFLIHIGVSKLKCCKLCKKYYTISKMKYEYCSESCKKRADG